MPDNIPEITIAFLNYNTADDLIRAIHSVPEACGDINYHITVIDDRKPVYDAFTGANVKVHKSFFVYIVEDGIKEDSMIVVFTPSITNSSKALFILLMASSRVCAVTINFAIIES